MRSILIIGGTSIVGRQLASQLLDCAHVRALVRAPDTACLPRHVEVVHGDLTVPETIDRCLIGVHAVFLIWTAPPAAVAPALEHILNHAQRIVFLSAPLKTPHPFFQQPNPLRAQTEQIERLIETSKLKWTFLRPGMFAANALRFWAPQIRAGDVVRWPYLSAATAPIHERDIAAVAVRALCEDLHVGAEYVLTGPESLSQLEQIEIIGRALRSPLNIEEIAPDEARRQLPAMLLDAWAATIGQPAFVTPTFEEITGSRPRTFSDWVIDHLAEFKRLGSSVGE